MVSLQAALVALALSGVSQSQTVLLDFYSDSCSPCRAMNPTVQALVAKGYPVQRINRDKSPDLAARFSVQRIPCFIMIVDGKVVDRVEGSTTFSRLEKMCKIQKPAAPLPNPPPTMLANNRTPAVQPAFYTAPIPQAIPDSPGAMPIAAQPFAQQAQATNGIPDSVLNAALAASVRLRIEDPDGFSSGSGTIVDARGGKAMVLTCGHIFRDSQGKGKIHIDLFGPNGPQSVEGTLFSYDLTRDVGLVVFNTSGPVATARLAPPGYRVAPGMPVASVGCNNGDVPTVRRSQINSLDKFLGPPNIQVNDQPVQGRSGGGLFSSEGYVIGVCNAADPSDKEGLFAALGTIYAELDQRDKSFIYKAPSGNPAAGSEAARPEAFASNSPPSPMPERMPGAADMAGFNSSPMPTAEAPAKLAPHEQAAMDELHRRLKEGSEVVCVIRPRGKPNAQSEVIMLDRASPEFVKQIESEGRRPDKPYQTSMGLPKPRKILLEWTAPAKGNGH